MTKKRKQIPAREIKHPEKRVVEPKRYSSDSMKIAWCLDMVDKNGLFRFVPTRPDFDCEKIMEKMIFFQFYDVGGFEKKHA